MPTGILKTKPPIGRVARNAQQSEVPHLWNGLVLAMPFVEGSGGPRDYSGNGNHGALNGDPQWVASPWGSALDFDGAADYVAIDAPAFDDTTYQFTVAAWILPGTQQRGDVYSEGNSSTNDPLVRLSINEADGNENNVSFNVRDEGATNELKAVTGDVGVQDGDWHLVAGRCLGDSEVDVWFDGEEITSDTSSTLTSVPLDLSSIGVLRRDSSAVFYSGTAIMCNVWPRVLTAAELRDLYQHPFRLFRRRSRISTYAAAISGGGGTTYSPYWGAAKNAIIGAS